MWRWLNSSDSFVRLSWPCSCSYESQKNLIRVLVWIRNRSRYNINTTTRQNDTQAWIVWAMCVCCSWTSSVKSWCESPIGRRVYAIIGSLSKTVKDDDGKTISTITLITQDKKRTWISEIRLIFVPSCSRVRRQLLHFHVVCKTWSVFQELTSIFSFRKRRWKQLKLSELIEANRATKANICPEKHKDYFEIFLLLPNVVVVPNNTNSRQNKTFFHNESQIFWRFSCIT